MLRRYLAAVLIASALFFAIIISNGCGKDAGDEPTRYQSQAGLEKLTVQARTAQNNPGFSLARNIIPANATAKDIDSIIRPVLVKMFKDAKLVSAKGPEAPRWDGEVVEDRLVYSVKDILTMPDGDRLHSAFRAAGFPSSPRLGSKPQHGRNNIMMSLFRSTSLRGYSFEINVDIAKQQISVMSYKLGSKYDRLM
jgi:hypothetical protein